MTQSCGYKSCSRKVSDAPQLSRNKIHTNYCSLYCREATLNNIKPINRTAYNSINMNCSVCLKGFDLRYEEAKGNQRFCGRECYKQLRQRHNGHRDFMILSILHETGPLTSSDIAKISSSFQKKSTVGGIGLILNAWRGRGIVSRYKESEYEAYTYTYVSKLFPGEAVLKFCRR